MNDEGSLEDAASPSAAARHISPPVSADSGAGGARRPARVPRRRVSRWHAAALAWAGVAGLLACLLLAPSGAVWAAQSASSPALAGPRHAAPAKPTATSTATATPTPTPTATPTPAERATLSFDAPAYQSDGGRTVEGPIGTLVTLRGTIPTGNGVDNLADLANLGYLIVPATSAADTQGTSASPQASECNSASGTITSLTKAHPTLDPQRNLTFTFPWDGDSHSADVAYHLCLKWTNDSLLAPTNWPVETSNTFTQLGTGAPDITQITIQPTSNSQPLVTWPASQGNTTSPTVTLMDGSTLTVVGDNWLPGGQTVDVQVTLGKLQMSVSSVTVNTLGHFSQQIALHTSGAQIKGQLNVTVSNEVPTAAHPALSNAATLPVTVNLSPAPLLKPTPQRSPFIDSILAVALDLLALALAGGGVFALWLGFAGSGGGSGGNGRGPSGGYRQPVASSGRPGYGPPQVSGYGPSQAPGYGQQVMPAPMPSGPLRMPPGQMPPPQIPGRPSPPPSSLPPDSPLYGHGSPADQQYSGDPGNGSPGT